MFRESLQILVNFLGLRWVVFRSSYFADKKRQELVCITLGFFPELDLSTRLRDSEEKLARTLQNDSHFRNPTTFSVISGQLETTVSFPPGYSENADVCLNGKHP